MNLREALIQQAPSLALQRAAAAEIARLDAALGAQPAAQAVARCIPVESCKGCPHCFGRGSCAKAGRSFDSGRPGAPPDWCPLPAFAAPAVAPPAVQPLTPPAVSMLLSANYPDGDDGEMLLSGTDDELIAYGRAVIAEFCRINGLTLGGIGDSKGGAA